MYFIELIMIIWIRDKRESKKQKYVHAEIICHNNVKEISELEVT
jgi:hypothetical protein